MLPPVMVLVTKLLNKMKRITRILMKPWVFGITLLIILSNLPPLKHILGLAIDEYHYRYSNINGSLTYVEFKAHDIKGMYRSLSSYKTHFPNANDTIMYRLYKRNLLCFWRWGEYIYDQRYKLPYKRWTEIRKRRGYDLEYSNNWQDF